MELKFKVQTGIQKPVNEVFDAVYNPTKLSGYFTTGGASAPLDPGTTVEWRFADWEGSDASGFPVHVKEVVPNERIVLEWEAEKGRPDTQVEMTFQAIGDRHTLVTITETGWSETQTGLDSSYSNCQGWMQMSCCLKAFVEHGINLRIGANPKVVWERMHVV
ncbi:MAG: SRPBCC domain-containing protein [Pyrinomonadaceae bacterium]